MSDRKVVVTGIGLITPCGVGPDPYWAALSEGRSFIQYLDRFQMNGFPSKLAGQLPDFDFSKYVKKRKLLKVMSLEIKLAVAASQIALEDSGVSMEGIDPFRFGVSLGTGIINTELDEIGAGIRGGCDDDGEFQMTKFGKEGVRSLFPLWFLKYLPNMPACHISISNGLKGPNNTITTSSAAGAQSIGEAYQVIRRGDADLMMAGGTDSKVNAMGISRFHLLGLLSSRNSVPPNEVYCPFDKKSDGIILGEGAGLLILEEKEHALKRGAKIYGEIAGYGASSDYNYNPSDSDDSKGKSTAMSRALNNAGMSPSDIDFLVANGSGVPQQDEQEMRAVHEVFQDDASKLKVTAVKPVTGHMVYGSGSVELVAGMLSMKNKAVPPVLNLQEKNPNYPLSFVTEKAEALDSHAFLCNSFGFGGQNTSLVVKQ